MPDYVLEWGTLAIINAAIANSGGRGALKYLLLSVFLGPVATIFLATTREDAQGRLHLADLWSPQRSV